MRDQRSPRMYSLPHRSYAMVVLSVFVLLLVNGRLLAQAQTEAADESVRFSGFMDDYSGLQPHPGRDNMLLYRRTEGALRPYTKFLIDPVLVYFHPDARGKGVDPEDLNRLANYFRDEAVKELMESGRYEVVEQPGPGVLRIRAAITDVVPVGKGANAALKTAGVAASRVAAPGVGMLVPRVDIGEASIEVEMLDSETEERVVAVVDTKRGRRFFSFFRGLRTWGDVEAAFRSWAEEFREVLDGLHQ